MTGRELFVARTILVFAGIFAVPLAYLETLFREIGSAFGYARLSASENISRAISAWHHAGFQTWDEYKRSFKDE
jgi:hypothetical protein